MGTKETPGRPGIGRGEGEGAVGVWDAHVDLGLEAVVEFVHEAAVDVLQ